MTPPGSSVPLSGSPSLPAAMKLLFVLPLVAASVISEQEEVPVQEDAVDAPQASGGRVGERCAAEA